MSGKLYFPGQADADYRQYVVLELALLISDHLIENGGNFEDVYFAFQCWLRESQRFRNEEDIDI
jgi:hypothetical protein